MYIFSPLVNHERCREMHRHFLLKMIENTLDHERSYSLLYFLKVDIVLGLSGVDLFVLSL